MVRTYKPPVPVKRIKYRGIGRPVEAVSIGGIRRQQTSQEHEVLTGMIGDMKASAGEERWARVLNVNKTPFEFRLALGGPRNAPGFFELDFLFPIRGVYRALEVDSLFTHKEKFYKDKLHDAWVINELEYLGLFPQVYHIDNEQHLATQDIANRTYQELFP